MEPDQVVSWLTGNPGGGWTEYFRGSHLLVSPEEQIPVAKVVWSAYQLGLVILAQKRVDDYVYSYQMRATKSSRKKKEEFARLWKKRKSKRMAAR